MSLSMKFTTPFAAVILLAGCDAQVEISSEDENNQTPSELILSEVSSEHVRTHMTFLADDLLMGRDTGTDGFEIAARYVAAQFQLLGLKPAGDDGTFYQSVPLVTTRIVPDSYSMRIAANGEQHGLAFGEDYLVFGGYGETSESITAPVVFAGYGVSAPELSHDDYSGIDAVGKIVAILDRAPAGFPNDQRAYYSTSAVKAQNALDHGALGAVTLRTKTSQGVFPWERIQGSVRDPRMRWVDQSGAAFEGYPELKGGALFSVAGATRLFELAGQDYDVLVEQAETGKPVSTDLAVILSVSKSSRQENIASRNVVAMLEGSDPALKKEYVIVSAHLDHVGVLADSDAEDKIRNGAYDNASGIGVMLEIARVFSEMNERPGRSILFIAVTAEEKGLLGSSYFARNPTVPASSIVANVNIDMPILLYPLADVIPFGADHSSLLSTVERAGNETGFALAQDPFPEQTIFIRSDQFSFVKQGVPAVFLVPGQTSTDPDINGGAIWDEFLGTHYHNVTDDLSRPFDHPSAARYTAMNALIVLDIANADTRPEWNEGDFFGDKFGADR